MSARRRLARLATAFPPAPSGTPTERALAVIAKGQGSVADFELAYGEQLAAGRQAILACALLARAARLRGERVWAAWPCELALQLASYRLDEEPPAELAEKLRGQLRVPQSHLEAALALLVLGGPDGLPLRRELAELERRGSVPEPPPLPPGMRPRGKYCPFGLDA